MIKHRQAEIIEDANLFTTRIVVPGGWIYRSYDKHAGILGMCFVPLSNNTESEEEFRKRFEESYKLESK